MFQNHIKFKNCQDKLVFVKGINVLFTMVGFSSLYDIYFAYIGPV